jgi:tyrosyl-tRNA synthetase
MPEYTLAVPAEGLGLARALCDAGLVKSTSDARRLLEQGGVELDGARVADKNPRLAPGARHVVKVGKLKWAVLRT